MNGWLLLAILVAALSAACWAEYKRYQGTRGHRIALERRIASGTGTQSIPAPSVAPEDAEGPLMWWVRFQAPDTQSREQCQQVLGKEYYLVYCERCSSAFGGPNMDHAKDLLNAHPCGFFY